MSPARRRRAFPNPVPAVPAGSWKAAGNLFIKRRMNEPVPISAYRTKVTGVNLNGGQASGPASAAGTLTLTSGPQGYGTIWYPAQVTLSASLGPLDNSTATVYLGAGGVPTTQVGQLYPGNGVLALAVPPMQAGDNIIVQWAGATPGEILSLNIIGTSDSLTTGPGQ